jgi:hypothetical protein
MECKYIYMYIYVCVCVCVCVCVSNLLSINSHNIIINIIYNIRNINIFLSIVIIKPVIFVRIWNVIISTYMCVCVCQSDLV